LSVATRSATAAALAFAVVLCGGAREARADYLFTPFIGGTFAGRTVFLTGREEGVGSQRLMFGGSVGWLSAGLLGIEGDFSYTPGMFQRNAERAIPEGFVFDSSVTTLSGSVIVAVPQAVTGYSLRPYLVGGVGLIQTDINYDDVFPTVDDNSLGFNVGGGAIGFLTQRTGVRFELRHFRTFDREPNELSLEVLPRLSFWRFTVGVVIRR
jgi:opacity protein-like surface antigen